jgi:uncharacterized protein with HEPN domain
MLASIRKVERYTSGLDEGAFRQEENCQYLFRSLKYGTWVRPPILP